MLSVLFPMRIICNSDLPSGNAILIVGISPTSSGLKRNSPSMNPHSLILISGEKMQGKKASGSTNKNDQERKDLILTDANATEDRNVNNLKGDGNIMASVRAIGILIICALIALFLCLGNKEAFKDRGVANAIVTYLVITGMFFGFVMLVWWAIRMIVLGVM